MPRFILILGLLPIGLSIPAQEPLTHIKKTFTSPDGKFYVQADLPVFIWLSTSPDDSSKKYRLWSEVTKEYSNPMYFDSEGYNTIRSPWAVDTTTHKMVLPKRDIVFEVYADGSAPVTKIDYGETKLFRHDKKLHVGGNTLITLSATDALSGVENIYYSINESPYKPYSAAISIDEENEYHLAYYAVDNVVNEEAVHEVTLVLDKTSPVTKLVIEGDEYENILSARSKIILKTEDKNTGIQAIYYAIDSGARKIYTTPLLAAYLSQDDHLLNYFAVDRVGNKEQTQSFAFYVDKTPPTIIEEVMGKSFFAGGKEFSSGKSRLKLTSFDNKAGVKEVRYSVNNGEYQLYTSPVFLTQSSGNLIIKSYAIDNVNNRSTSKTANDHTSIPYIDLTGPELGYSLTGPKFKTRDTLFINSETKIHLKATDPEAGVNHIEYSVNGSNPSEYNEPFTIENEGSNTIDFTGFDNVDNTNASAFNVKVDNTGPDIGYAYGTSWIRKEGNLEVYPSHTVIFLTATDKVVGFQRMTFSINGGATQEYSGLIKNLPKGNNELKITAYDQLGNSKELTINYIIEK
jgi:hypothetical protein